MLQKIKQLINAANPNYNQYYAPIDEANIKADEQTYDGKYVLIEEIQDYKYVKRPSNIIHKVPTVRLFVYTFSQLENDAETRETLRYELDRDFVSKLNNILKQSPYYEGLQCTYPSVPRFDANETAIIVEFDYPITIC